MYTVVLFLNYINICGYITGNKIKIIMIIFFLWRKLSQNTVVCCSIVNEAVARWCLSLTNLTKLFGTHTRCLCSHTSCLCSTSGIWRLPAWRPSKILIKDAWHDFKVKINKFIQRAWRTLNMDTFLTDSPMITQ